MPSETGSGNQGSEVCVAIKKTRYFVSELLCRTHAQALQQLQNNQLLS